MHRVNKKQVFQSNDLKRWKIVRSLFFAISGIFILICCLIAYSLSNRDKYWIPKDVWTKALDQIAIKDTTDNYEHTEFKKAVERIRKNPKNELYNIQTNTQFTQKGLKPLFPVHAGFFVNWDIQAFQSLQKHAASMNVILPEWFFISDTSDEVINNMNTLSAQALKTMRDNHVIILPMVSNFFNGRFNGNSIRKITHSPKRRKVLIESIVKQLNAYHFHGINIDFEELNETTDEYLIAFQKELYRRLHSLGYLVSMDVSPFNEDYNYKTLDKYNDLLFLMAYDQHNASTVPGDMCSYKWVENALDEAQKEIPSQKIVLCAGIFGYDWPIGYMGHDITYEEAIALAKQHDSIPIFNNETYNLHFKYVDENKQQHVVNFTDAASFYNLIRASEDFETSGYALWRLGSEDERIWTFFDKQNSQQNSKNIRSFLTSLESTQVNKSIDYIGAGEILNVLSSPSVGKIKLEYDTDDQLISEEYYQSLPSGYVIGKTGEKSKKIVLSFDDGPDEKYTTEILTILKQYKVPATFFVLGANIQSNLPTFRKLLQSGNEIGNHSYTHVNFSECSKERIELELRSTRRMIEAISGKSTILYRPPFTIDAEPTSVEEIYPLSIGKQENYVYIGASNDTRDWEKDLPADSIVQRAIRQRNNGNIILLHDAGGNRTETVKALPKIIEYFLNNGYEFTTVSDLSNIPKTELMPELKGENKVIYQNFNRILILSMYYFESILFYFFISALILMTVRLVLIIISVIIRKNQESNIRSHQDALNSPYISILVPAYNEEIVIQKTIQSLLELNYPNFDILIINDGSTDNTEAIIQQISNQNKQVYAYTIQNSGKASALNFGISKTNAPYIVCVDADTELDCEALTELLKGLINKNTAAVAGYVEVNNEIYLLTRWQRMEYTTSQNFERYAFDSLNSIMVVPGAIGLFDRSKVLEVGGFDTDTMAEDCDLTLRLLAKGYEIHTVNSAIAYTEVPETLRAFMKQRKRWCFGVLQSFWKHKNQWFSFSRKNMGWIVLPNIFIYQIILPLFSPIVDLLILLSLFFQPVGLVLGLYFLYMMIDVIIVSIAYRFKGEKPGIKTYLALIPQRIIYRQLYFTLLIQSILKAFKGELQHWGILKRSGNSVKQNNKND